MEGRYHYFTLLIVVAVVDIVLGILNHNKKKKRRVGLTASFVASALVCLNYAFVIGANHVTMAMAFSSAYYISVAFVVIACLRYVLITTGANNEKNILPYKVAVLVGFLIEIILMLANPFSKLLFEITVNDQGKRAFESTNLMLYHYIFCFTVAGIILVFIFKKIVSLPSIYRVRYRILMIFIAGVIVVRILMFFLGRHNAIDYSVILYSIVFMMIYGNALDVAKRKMSVYVRSSILDELNKCILIFDHNKQCIVINSDAGRIFFSSEPEVEAVNLKSFAEDYKLSEYLADFETDNTFGWKLDKDGVKQDFIVDYRLLKDHNKMTIGYALVFSDNYDYIDVLTGFNSYTGFVESVEGNSFKVNYPACLVMFDINGLSEINDMYGTLAGDNAIVHLAHVMRTVFPQGALLGRLRDANLVAYCSNMTSEQGKKLAAEVRNRMYRTPGISTPLQVSFATGLATTLNSDITELIQVVENDLISRKMVDRNSLHSSLADVVVQIQKENDPAQEAHIERMRGLAQVFAEHLELPDNQKSDLQLLCVLYDLGKIGVPFEILNRPGKLSEKEWKLLMSHVEKGYRISAVAPEFETVGMYVLHHHENWDGSGYPDGLSKTSIPILSRIIAILDTYDALTNDRPYRKAISPKAAYRELEKNAGTMFDPDLVSSFVSLMEMIVPLPDAGDISENIENPLSMGASIYDADSNRELSPVIFSKYMLDEDENIIEIDSEFTLMTGYTLEDVKQMKLKQIDLIFPEDRESYVAKVNNRKKKGDDIYISHRIRCKDGSERRVFCYGRLFFDPVTMSIRVEVMVTDVSQNYDAEIYRNRTLINTYTEEKMVTTGIYKRGVFADTVTRTMITNDSPFLFALIGVVGIENEMAEDEMLLKAISVNLREALNASAIVGFVESGSLAVWQKVERRADVRVDMQAESDISELWGAVSAAVSHIYADAYTVVGGVWSENNVLHGNAFYKQAGKMLNEAYNKKAGCYICGKID